MNKPSEVHEIDWNGLKVTVSEYCDPTDSEWDGDEPLEPGSEGFDQAVEVTVEIDGQRFEGHDSLCGTWIFPNREGYDYLVSVKKDLLVNALHNLGTEIRRVASGADVEKAKTRAIIARKAVKSLPAA
jgi:hypothetical protein